MSVIEGFHCTTQLLTSAYSWQLMLSKTNPIMPLHCSFYSTLDNKPLRIHRCWLLLGSCSLQWEQPRERRGRASIFKLKEFRCYEGKIEESEKGSSRHELHPGYLWLEPSVLCYWATTAGQTPTLKILYMYCTGGTECPSRTPEATVWGKMLWARKNTFPLQYC